jgi:hypothetical protein
MVAPKEEGNLDGMKSDLRIPAIKKFVTYAGGKNFFSQQIPTESKYPPAKPGALDCWPLKAAGQVADATCKV